MWFRPTLCITRSTLKAIETLQAVAPYELGSGGGLCPVYVRGEAYLVGDDR